MVAYEPITAPLTSLLLDPNNFRFRKPGPVVDVAESRLHEDTVQSKALDRIKTDGLTELKRSIAENGFVPVERIVVRQIGPTSQNEQPMFVAVEGNRRTAALKLLQQDYAGGVDLPQSVVDVFSAVPVLVATDASAEDLLAIMGIRHVGGPKEWGGYQSALLVYQLIENEGSSSREVASRLSLTVNEVNRRHRAFAALTQMIEDQEFGESVTPEMYPIFHEAVGQPTIREWLSWDPKELVFANETNRELLYTWVVGGDGEPKINGYREMRDLKQILENQDALTALKDDDQTFADALAIVKSDAKAVRWLPNVRAALSSLDEMGPDTIENLGKDELDLLNKLKLRAAWIVRANKIWQTSPELEDED